MTVAYYRKGAAQTGRNEHIRESVDDATRWDMMTDFIEGEGR